jgi:Endoribonuclease L-PSP
MRCASVIFSSFPAWRHSMRRESWWVGMTWWRKRDKYSRNLKKILDAAQASFSDVLKVTVFLTDVGDRSAINPVRQQYFGAARPASTLIGVKELAVPGMKVEIEAVIGLSARSHS